MSGPGSLVCLRPHLSLLILTPRLSVRCRLCHTILGPLFVDRMAAVRICVDAAWLTLAGSLFIYKMRTLIILSSGHFEED